MQRTKWTHKKGDLLGLKIAVPVEHKNDKRHKRFLICEILMFIIFSFHSCDKNQILWKKTI